MPTRKAETNFVPAPQFFMRSLLELPGLLLADHLLVHQPQHTKDLDIYFASMDGTFGGVRHFLHPNVPASWSFHVEGEHFACSPIGLVLPELEQDVLLVVSTRGTMHLFYPSGTILTRIRIPDLYVDAHATRTLSLIDAPSPHSHFRWATDDMSEQQSRLSPAVYTSPLFLPGPCDHVTAGRVGSDFGCVVIPVNFVDRNNNISLLASLLAISLQALVPTTDGDMSSDRWAKSTVLLPLELGESDQSNPPYLFSALTLVASPLPSDLAWEQPRLHLVVTLYSGSVYRVPIPFGPGDAQTRSMVWRPASRSPLTGFSHFCVIIDCPRLSSHRLCCCLLLDDASNLYLITLDVTSAKSPLLLWTYRPVVPAGLQQTGSVTIITPGSCTVDAVSCQPWAVYASPDGFVHVVDILTGSRVPGYPVQLAEDGMDDGIFASGPGVLYTPDERTPWMIFSTKFGDLYHLRMTDPPLVVKAQPPADRHSSNASSTTWISPTPVKLSATHMGLIVAHPTGIGLLLPENASSHKLREFPVFDATFLDHHHQRPASVLHLDADHQSVGYRIHNCPLAGENSTTTTSYAARLVDIHGRPLSAWSMPTFVSPPHLSTTCQGSISFPQPVYRSFRQRVYLMVIHRHTGRLMVTASVLLDAHSQWPEVLIVLVHLPVVYFFSYVIVFGFWRRVVDLQSNARCSV